MHMFNMHDQTPLECIYVNGKAATSAYRSLPARDRLSCGPPREKDNEKYDIRLAVCELSYPFPKG